MTSSPEAAAEDAAGAAAAPAVVSCANAVVPKRHPPSASATTISFFIISILRAPDDEGILSGAVIRLNCDGPREAVSGFVGATYHLQQGCRRFRARARRP